jgi:hypothetical protein
VLRSTPRNEKPTVRFRHHAALAVAGVVTVVAGIPLATTAWYLAPILLVPLAVAVWAWRAGTDADRDGLVVRALLGSRRIAWSEVAELTTDARGQALARLADGRGVPLTAVGAADLPRLADEACRSRPSQQLSAATSGTLAEKGTAAENAPAANAPAESGELTTNGTVAANDTAAAKTTAGGTGAVAESGTVAANGTAAAKTTAGGTGTVAESGTVAANGTAAGKTTVGGTSEEADKKAEEPADETQAAG